MALVCNGTELERTGGSDTEESDSEQPLRGTEQVVAILGVNRGRPPPPLPVEAKHARATASAVLQHVRSTPAEKRTVAYEHALRTPIVALTVEGWVDQQLDDRRTERTMRLAFCFALNPRRSNIWVAKKARGNLQSASAAKGMALHLRCHPFTRSDAQHACDALPYYCKHREARNLARALMRERAACGSDALDAAVVLVGFHSVVRHFGAHRYRFPVK